MGPVGLDLCLLLHFAYGSDDQGTEVRRRMLLLTRSLLPTLASSSRRLARSPSRGTNADRKVHSLTGREAGRLRQYSLAGPPLTQYSAPVVLHRAGVKVALGVPEEWQAMHLRWEAAWAQRNSDGQVRREDAIAWISTNLDELLDLPDTSSDFVAYEVQRKLC